MNSGNALIQHLSEKCDFRVFPVRQVVQKHTLFDVAQSSVFWLLTFSVKISAKNVKMLSHVLKLGRFLRHSVRIALLLSAVDVHGYSPQRLVTSTIISILKGPIANGVDSGNYRGIPVSSIFGGPFVKRFALSYQTVVCPVLSCLSCLSVCDVGVLWPNGWMDQDKTWHAGRPRPWPHYVRWEPSSPSPKGAQPPIFGPRLLWPNGWID